MDTKGTVTDSTNETSRGSQEDLVLTRVFNAPRRAVFKAWTDPNSMIHWWGPRGFTAPVCESDARPGGKIRIHLRAPNGTIYPSVGVYHEVTEPERIVASSSVLDPEGNPLFEVLNTVTFNDQEGGTKLTLRAHIVRSTPEGAPMLAGMKPGWTQTLDRLEEFLGGSPEA